MLTSKQRAYLRSMANGLETIFHIGKSGVTPELTDAVDNALEARELIKVHILETAFLDVKPACNEIAQRLGAEPIQAIGSKFVLYKQAEDKKNRKIELPRK